MFKLFLVYCTMITKYRDKRNAVSYKEFIKSQYLQALTRHFAAIKLANKHL